MDDAPHSDAAIRAIHRVNRIFSPNHALSDELALPLADAYGRVGKVLEETLERFHTKVGSSESLNFQALMWLYSEFPSTDAAIAARVMPEQDMGAHSRVRSVVIEGFVSAGYKDFIIDELRAMSYSDYLQTPHWRAVRDGALNRADGHCQICGHDQDLEVHHNSYKRRGYERSSDLVVLCSTCHELFHKNSRVRS